MATANQLPPPKTKRFLTFNGPIRPPSTINLRGALCEMVNQGAKEITVLFTSDGGSLSDGIALFSYLRALPVELTMHAVGFVQSIAVPMFLAGHKRLAADSARFLFHGYSWTSVMAETASMETLEERTMTLENAVAWAKGIVKTTTKLTDTKIESLHLFDRPRIVSPAECADWDIVSEVVEPKTLLDYDPRVVG